MPTKRTALLRKAFAATMNDPDYRADAAQQSIDVDPVYADELTSILEHVYHASPKVIARAREITDTAR